MKRVACGALVAVAALASLLAGCAPPAPPPPPASGAAPPAAQSSTNPNAIRFWHTQTREFEKLLLEIVASYNAQPGVTPVDATYIGNYTQLFEKIRAGLHATDASARPDLAVAYESMVAEYRDANAVRNLDDLVSDPAVGLDRAALDDFYPAFLEMNRFPQFDDEMLSFPFTKSMLMLYSNTDLIKDVGAQPPQTWAELLDVCRKIKAKHPDVRPFALFKDASAMDAIFLTFGAKLLETDGSAGFSSPAAVEALAFWDTMVKEKLAYEPTEKDKQVDDFAAGKTAFFLRSSNARSDVALKVQDKFDWDAGALPYKAGLAPVTVLFGANICVLRSTPEREKAAWAFIKYFSSPEVTAKWAAGTGYQPVRKSALETRTIVDYLAAAPQNRRALEIMDTAVPEPNVAGWQDVREALDKAHMDVMNQLATPEAIAKELDTKADQALAKAKAPAS